jgi:PAS domain-containing protein
MDIRETLTMRTVTALQRLADLEERGRALAGPKAAVLRTALRELESALEELRVATEQLNEMVDEMSGARLEAKQIESQFTVFRNLLPLGCIITDAEGVIAAANSIAGDLLNVAPRHLAGKPLALYMVDRDRFFGMLSTLRLTRETVKKDLGVRPRERKPRPMNVHLTQIPDTPELYWFLQEPVAAAANTTTGAS